MVDPVTAAALGIPSLSMDSAKVPAVSSSQTAAANGVGTFADVLADMGQQTINKLNTAESLSIDGIRGDAGPREVAEAVMSAEQSLQIAIAVRDKVVSAYLEISRMSI